jgi:hypothetical protein
LTYRLSVVSEAQSLTIHGSGSDVVLNSTALTRLPFNNSFTQMEATKQEQQLYEDHS